MMKIKTLIIASILLVSAQTFAQGEGESGAWPQPVRKSKVPVWINLAVGGNIAHCYDNGTIPFPYLGFGGNAGVGATVEWKRFHIQTETRLFGELLENGGTAIDVEGKTEFLYRFHDGKRNRLHLWAGGAMQVYYDIKDIPSMMNASTGVSGFHNLCAVGMLSYDFAFIRNGSHNLLTAYAKLNLPVAGAVVRPGYAYMDNYTSDINLANTILGDYVLFGKWLPGASTDTGLKLNLLNGNVIALNYRWDYLSTGRKDVYRFDNAIHSFNILFMFNIN